MPQMALREDWMFVAQAQQCLDVRKYSLLLWRAAVWSEGVFGVVAPAAGKIVAIIWVVAPGMPISSP